MLGVKGVKIILFSEIARRSVMEKCCATFVTFYDFFFLNNGKMYEKNSFLVLSLPSRKLVRLGYT